MPCGHLNAMRFDQKPLPQPGYSFVHVPKAKPTLENSSLQTIANREEFQTCMAEMLLLSKEAVRRRKNVIQTDAVVTNSGAKPLSLEYIADRMDIDEPCFGYLVRTKKKPEDLSTTMGENNASFWQEGMMQGFITITCFTNWQKTFKFDSLHPEAYGFDSDSLTAQRKNGKRKWDQTGELAKELQQTVHKGDIWNEGIVWPRIAEISLLGALGCGKTLVQLAIENLENLKPNAEQNYDYVVLQATDNSVPFYESLGFVRVGGIMEKTKDDGEDEEEEPMSEIVTSEITTYVTKKRGETPLDIAKKFEVDVWDIIFLNKKDMPMIKPKSKFLIGTTLEIPVTPKAEPRAPTRTSTRNAPINEDEQNESTSPHPTIGRVHTDSDGISWYQAKENDTPNKISKMVRVNCRDLIQANSARLPGLMAKSRLKNGTRVQISHFHLPSKVWTAYAHWSFPDNKTEPGEPSYLMCYKLNKGSAKKSKELSCPVAASLKASVEDYTVSPLLLMPPDENPEVCSHHRKTDPARIRILSDHGQLAAGPKSTACSATPVLIARDTNRDRLVQLKVLNDGKSVPPGNLMGTSDANTHPKISIPELPRAFKLFCEDMKKRKNHLLEGLENPDKARLLANRWKEAPLAVKQKFEKLASESKQDVSMQKNEKFGNADKRIDSPSLADAVACKSSKKKKDHSVLFNKVVKLKPEAIPFIARASCADAKAVPGRFKYWFCLHFVPDLAWVSLVPMKECGIFDGEDKKLPSQKIFGMTKWVLVDETEDEEIELSSRYVIPVKSRETKKSADANKEEWAIFEEETILGPGSNKNSRKRSRADPSTKSQCKKKRQGPKYPISRVQPASATVEQIQIRSTVISPNDSNSNAPRPAFFKEVPSVAKEKEKLTSLISKVPPMDLGTPGPSFPEKAPAQAPAVVEDKEQQPKSISMKLSPMDLGIPGPSFPEKVPAVAKDKGQKAASTSMKLPPMNLGPSLCEQEMSTGYVNGIERISPAKPGCYPPSIHPHHVPYQGHHQNPRYSYAPYHQYEDSHPGVNYQYDPSYQNPRDQYPSYRDRRYYEPSTHNTRSHFVGPPSYQPHHQHGRPSPKNDYEQYHHQREVHRYPRTLSQSVGSPCHTESVGGLDLSTVKQKIAL